MSDFQEVSPPGWGGTVSAMKKHHPEIKNPWALAWSMKKKGDQAHYKNDPKGSKSKTEPVKKAEYRNEGYMSFSEWIAARESITNEAGS